MKRQSRLNALHICTVGNYEILQSRDKINKSRMVSYKF